MARQVRRWAKQWDATRDRDRPGMDALAARLAETVPTTQRDAVVHGDYRLDNCLLDPGTPGRIRAVLDWEMSTLGDPLSDAALMCVYRHPVFNLIHASSAWASPLIPEVDELANRYSVAAGQSLDNWDFYMALGYFKVAIIAAGIAFRARMGGGVAADTDAVDQAVAPLIAEGLSALSPRV
jgi:aminoglycoside phosphotransferase (APT) family kinase protein